MPINYLPAIRSLAAEKDSDDAQIKAYLELMFSRIDLRQSLEAGMRHLFQEQILLALPTSPVILSGID